ncbi:MAG: hypothetical protein NZ529_10580 [Cytophagaceae bacterium]|nr:hypothetical protein [Cytophagaceae bacterium]MDW8457232.1 hypothetical protein [Cytophagaceae bacterium]
MKLSLYEFKLYLLSMAYVKQFFSILTIVMIIFLSSHSLLAQDLIYMKDGKEMKTRVFNITKKDIHYKMLDDPEFRTYTMPKSEVRKIRFQYGKVLNFEKIPYHFLSFEIGRSLPLSYYRRADLITSAENISPSGFAESGPHVKIEGGYYWKKNWAVAAKIGHFSNAFKTSEFADNFLPFYSYFSYPENENIRWRNTYLHFGPAYSHAFSKSLFADISISSGPAVVYKPKIHVTYFKINPPVPDADTYISEGKRTITLKNFDFSTSLRFSIVRKLAIKLSAQYNFARPTFVFKESLNTDNGRPEINIRRTYRIETFSLTFGIAYQFKR